MPVNIIVTGGTFDKEYDEIKGQLYFKETHLPEILRLGRCTVPVHIDTLMMIDSLHMTDDDRARIVSHCAECSNKKIIITHGTDTMVETAKVLAAARLEKTIVLTGAMIPYKFGSSDGLFNMGCALSYVQTLPPGVYITMNGKCFTWDNVRKNREEGLFEELN
ncbi:MAG TPA: asparaginase domain-containing protein [Ferruginibacter sp.]|nr:asparaginase domain-containing protein [Chitinophagales bacterium]HNL66121.1 asparaginase domain-containing protein [Ferruginibacter sp.]HMX04701.1 asparaginase domain-containing protein [Chitinophagales bacterium]HNA58443.1 asparaginase domain-containing protein [Chitinophagales bacterium]HNE47213.1 asparaginase domain-containing protein [Chitinophagales bacterium]